MKFIFPKNYNFRTKLLGFIDYQTAIINGILGLVLYGIVNILFESIKLKIYFFVAFYFPVFLLSIFGFGKESIVLVIKYMYLFIKQRGVYLYSKDYKVQDSKENKYEKYIKKVVEIIDSLI